MQGVQGRYSSATGESRGEEIENKSVSGIMSSSAVVTAVIALLRRGRRHIVSPRAQLVADVEVEHG